MAMTLLGLRAMMAERRRDALRREAAAARKVQAARDEHPADQRPDDGGVLDEQDHDWCHGFSQLPGVRHPRGRGMSSREDRRAPVGTGAFDQPALREDSASPDLR